MEYVEEGKRKRGIYESHVQTKKSSVYLTKTLLVRSKSFHSNFFDFCNPKSLTFFTVERSGLFISLTIFPFFPCPENRLECGNHLARIC